MISKEELEKILCMLPQVDSYERYRLFVKESVRNIIGEYLYFNVDFDMCYKVYKEHLLGSSLFTDERYKITCSYQHENEGTEYSILRVYIGDDRVVTLKFHKHKDGKLNYSMLRDEIYSKDYYL